MNRLAVIMSIHPEYAKKIFSSEKKFEFRRTIFRRMPKKALVYATKPVQRIVGEFTIVRHYYRNLEDLWELTVRHAGIDYVAFKNYFKGKETGYAILIQNPVKYKEPKLIEDFGLSHPPQSFCYVDGG